MEQQIQTNEIAQENPFVNVAVEEIAASDIENAIAKEQNAIPYIPISKLPSMGTVIPLNLAGETMQAQFAFKEEVEDIDSFLVEKLKYTSKVTLSEAIRAEQADAVGLAIRQIEKGNGFIVADMAGIGKGRVGASILRYAKVNGYLPIFITEAPNLFTAMYRDIYDIGGIMTKGGGEKYAGNPFILNGFESGGYEIYIDAEGKKKRIDKPSKTSILSPITGKEIIVAPEQSEIKSIIQNPVLPKKYDYIFLTYSQLSQGKSSTLKVQWLIELIQKLDGKAILVMDECHNATGTTSSVGQAIQSLLSVVHGVTFMSATFSKRPDNMFMYALKTDVSKSPLGTKTLIEAIKKGGDKLTENLASNLVAAQQMLRRERTFDNCDVDYQYMSDDEKIELFEKYDNTISLYYKLLEFFSIRNPLFKDARAKSIERYIAQSKYQIVTEEMPSDAKERERWRAKHEGKYRIASFSAGEIKRSQFNFIETLLFALKADFVANAALSQLLNNDLINVSTKDKSTFKSNRKPVIAVRNTLESIFNNLQISVGDTIKKADFSLYILSLLKEALNGTITLVQFKEKGDPKRISEDWSIEITDFEDYGKRYNELVEEVENINLNIPLSPIDYVIDKIENTKRPAWDMQYSQTPNLRVVEVTGRSYRLSKSEEGYTLIKNPKPKSVSEAFKSFNNGTFDVILINEAGSTGEDAHSKESFRDKRPRVMIIHQVELNVNTEVQKRGRINRTGQVNYPSYVYAVSRIPSEIRRLLMLTRKLRTLDANTTANQKQSAKLSQIKDSFGNEIQDIINKYGDICLQTFLSVAENSKYIKYMPTDAQEKLGKLSIESDMGGSLIETFVRNLEVSLSAEQEYFYNVMNEEYKRYTDELKEDGRFDLETNIVDWKASVKTRTPIKKGDNTSPFSTSVYEEDDYILDEAKPYTKAKVDDLIIELGKGQDPEEFFINFLEDYKKHFKEERLKEIVEGVEPPKYEFAKDDEERKQLKDEYELRISTAVQRAKDEFNAVLQIFYRVKKDKDGLPVLNEQGYVITGDLTMKPNSPVLIPAVLEECYETDDDGLPMTPKELNNAKFCGVKILNTAKEKYSPMNIELSFCQLNGKPKLLLKPTSRGREILQWIVIKSEFIDRFRLIAIDNWDVDPNKRTITRLLTGNILGAYGIGRDTVKKDDNYSPVLRFVKFTTVDEDSIRLGIQLNMKRFVSLNPDRTPINYSLDASDLMPALLKTLAFTSVNANENFRIYGGSISNKIEIDIFGGRANEANPKKYYSKLYADGELITALQDLGLNWYKTEMYYQPVNVQRMVRIKVLRIQSYNFSKDAQDIKQIFDYIYKQDPFNIGILGSGEEEIIKSRADVFKAPTEADLQEEEQREYKYALSQPYKYVQENLVNLPKFVRYNSNDDTITLNSRANVREAIQYDLVPLEPTVKEMVFDTFQLLSDAEKIKFQEDLKKAIAEGKDDFQLGRMAEKLLLKKVVSWKPIYGYGWDDFEFVGQVLKAYIKGEVDFELKKVEKKEYKIEPKPLNIDTAQEFLIHLTFKVNN